MHFFIMAGLGQEDQLHKSFAFLVRGYEFYNNLYCHFWSYDASGEKRTATTGSLLKAKGLNRGKPDYEFKRLNEEGATDIIYLEFKSEKGKQSEPQKLFEKNCKKSTTEYYYVVRSVQEALEILFRHKIIKTL